MTNSWRAAAALLIMLLGITAAQMVAGGSAQEAGPAIVFVSPVDGGYISGPTTVSVRIVPAGETAKSVSLFADGKLLCTVEQPPYTCPWDAGPKVLEHLIRATAVLGDGRQIRTSIRTKGAEYTETVDVDVVQITATVTGSRGRFIRGLKASDFKVYEDRVPQTITAFAAENIPLELVVAVDVSGSMTKAMPTVKAAVRKFLTKLRPQDVVTVLGFNDNVFVIARPTVTLEDRLKTLDRLRPWGGTSLYDAMLKALAQLGPQAGRRVIVVFTDGEDLNSRVPLETAERGLESNDAVLYAIGLGRAPEMAPLRKVLERLSEKTGGQAYFEELDKLDEVFDNVLADLANQYLFGFLPRDAAHDGRWREIRVEVPGHDYKVRARKGYRTISR
ncbi:MAG: VWA domain-containing protein [Vicinamibacterales bacterium]|jgi:VWFA-related protein|nr:VWA domain-containing protein [Vicinamibacterales bacterium]